MKTRALTTKLNVVLCSAIALVSLAAHAAPGDEEVGGKLSKAFKEAQTESDIKVRMGKALDTIAQHTNLSRSEVFDFFKERASKMSEASSIGFAKLLNGSTVTSRTATKADFVKAEVTAETVSSYIAAEKNKAIVKNLPFSEVDLAKAADSWTPKQRENFAKVLKKTAQIAQNSNAPTLNDAFEQALKELGYLDEYRKGCKN